MRKGEIAYNEQFFLFPQCFQKPFAEEASESVCMWEKVNSTRNTLSLSEQRLTLSHLQTHFAAIAVDDF